MTKHQHGASDHIRVELIEADVDMAFGLVDDAVDEFHAGMRRTRCATPRQCLTDIEERLHQLGAARRARFGPLADELRKSIRAAQSECM